MSGERTCARPRTASRRIVTVGDALFPQETVRTNPLLATVVVVAGGATALWRLSSHAAFTSLFAEDGRIFAASALTKNYPVALASPYAGYMHSGPRTIAAIAAAFPVRDLAALFVLMAALTHGVVALFGYLAARQHVSGRVLQLITPAYLCAAPVGFETIDVVANLQWILLPGALLVLLWQPRSWFGVTGGALLLLIATTSSPFGLLLLPLVIVRLLHDRSTGTLTFSAATVLGIAVQGLVMLHAPARARGPHITALQVALRYMTRISGQAVVGTQRTEHFSYRGSEEVGIAGALLVLVLLGVLVMLHAWPGLIVASTALLASIAFFFVPIYLNAPPPQSATDGSRYLVPASICYSFALCVIADATIHARTISIGRRRIMQGPAAVVSVALVVVMCLAVATNWRLSSDVQRPVQNWPARVSAAALDCRNRPDNWVERIAISPSHWFTPVRCIDLR